MSEEDYIEFKNGLRFCKRCGSIMEGNICLQCASEEIGSEIYEDGVCISPF